MRTRVIRGPAMVGFATRLGVGPPKQKCERQQSGKFLHTRSAATAHDEVQIASNLGAREESQATRPASNAEAPGPIDASRCLVELAKDHEVVQARRARLQPVAPPK